MVPPMASSGYADSGLGDIDHENFAGQDHGRDGSYTLHGAVGHFGRVNDAGLGHVLIPLGHRVAAHKTILAAPVSLIVALWINNLVRYSNRSFIRGFIVVSFRQCLNFSFTPRLCSQTSIRHC